MATEDIPAGSTLISFYPSAAFSNKSILLIRQPQSKSTTWQNAKLNQNPGLNHHLHLIFSYKVQSSIF